MMFRNMMSVSERIWPRILLGVIHGLGILRLQKEVIYHTFQASKKLVYEKIALHHRL